MKIGSRNNIYVYLKGKILSLLCQEASSEIEDNFIN